MFKLTSKANLHTKPLRALFKFWMTVFLLTHRRVPSHLRCRAIWPRHQNCPPDVSIPTRKLNRTVNNPESHSKMAALSIGATIKLYVTHCICYLASFVSHSSTTPWNVFVPLTVASAYWTCTSSSWTPVEAAEKDNRSYVVCQSTTTCPHSSTEPFWPVSDSLTRRISTCLVSLLDIITSFIWLRSVSVAWTTNKHTQIHDSAGKQDDFINESSQSCLNLRITLG